MSFVRSFQLAILLVLFSCQAFGLRLNIRLTTPFVFIQVGHGTVSSYGMFGPPAGLVDEVSFPFPAGVQPGDGTAVVGTPVIPIMVLGYSGGNRTRFVVTMNSNSPLTNANGDQLPFTQFSWVSQDGDIPSGAFNGSTQQQLVSLDRRGRRARGYVDYLTFSYSNSNLYPAGSYQGQVVYTITNL